MKKQRVLALLLALSLALGTTGMSVLAAGPDVSGGAVMVENSGSPAGAEAPGAQIPAGEVVPDDEGNGGQITDDGTDKPDGSAGDDQNDPEQPGDTAGDNQKEQEAVQSLAPRMMTFQDETGMRITYDANARYVYTVDESGTLTGITNEDGSEVEGNVVLDETKGIRRIGSGAFTGNTKITYIKMPTGLTVIGAEAFKGCTVLRGMTIPTGVTAIEESAFEGCSALTQFAMPATMESIGNRAFYGDSRLFMVYMKSISISRLHSIGSYAFYGCATLVQFCSDTSFTFPDSLTSIGEHAFQECRGVKSIVRLLLALATIMKKE